MINKRFSLNSGYEIPAIGLGTYKVQGLEKLRSTIRSAISMGYRHIDTAYKYCNESDIGTVLKELFDEGILKRSDIFLTSKLWCTQHKDPERALDGSLKCLKLDYLDLYLIHFPVTFKVDNNCVEICGDDGLPIIEEFDAVDLWGKMEDMVRSGKVRSIGVSNFGVYNMTKILNSATIKPAVAQFELHPYLKQKELLKFCEDNNIRVVAYSSLGSTQDQQKDVPIVRKDERILKIGRKYDKTAPQVILSHQVQQGIAVIPKSVNLAHLKENLELFHLDEEDKKVLDGIDFCYRYINVEELGKDAFK